jgi:hypothetical protein
LKKDIPLEQEEKAMDKYGKYIVTQLKPPARFTPEFNARYAQWAKRILWLDEKVVPGAFQMNCSWYLRLPQEKTGEATAHTHNCDEIIGFFSGDPAKPYDLGAEVEFWLEDEMHLIKTSALIFVPAGMKHCPLILRRVDRPIFHFSTLTGGEYKSDKV